MGEILHGQSIATKTAGWSIQMVSFSKGIPPKENGTPRIPNPGPDGRTSKVK